MKIYITSVFVENQSKALSFYTDILGFEVKDDVPLGEHRWITVVSPDGEGGMELLLEPNAHNAVPPLQQALVSDGIPFTSFEVDNLDAEFRWLKGLGVLFNQEPMDAGPVKIAVFDDTCGNLIQLLERVE